MKGNVSWEKLKEKNPGKYPERMGFPWDYDEEYKVLQGVREKKTIEEIAHEHQRTYGSIFAKLKGFAFDYHNENKTIDQIKLYTGLSESIIRDVISERTSKGKYCKKDLDDKGYIYCFSNDSMPGLVKVGMTDRNPEERLKEANKPDTFKPPSPYKIEFVKYVKDPKEKEKTLHKLLQKYTERVHTHREFFRITPDDLRVFFDLIDGNY